MPEGARRVLSCRCLRLARRALGPAAFWLAVSGAATPVAVAGVCVDGDGPHIRKVCLEERPGAPVYGHDILGGTPEWDAVTVVWGASGQAIARGRRGTSTMMQRGHIFEDIAPRLVDLDRDGISEILLVQSSFSQGARLVVLATDGALKLRAVTPYIGRSHRWLAPVGAADLDGDGQMEIAYVETPHLGKTLKIVRLEGGRLVPVAAVAGLTNHRIGDAFIQGGIVTCGTRPTILTASADWTRIIATVLTGGKPVTRDLAPYAGPESFAAPPGCR